MENEDKNGYKIKCGYKYPVIKEERGEYVFYKIKMTKTNADGTKEEAVKNVRFASQELDSSNIQNGTMIIPKALFEDFYYKKADKNHYSPIFTVVITDWEVIGSTEEAIADFNTVEEEIDFPF